MPLFEDEAQRRGGTLAVVTQRKGEESGGLPAALTPLPGVRVPLFPCPRAVVSDSHGTRASPGHPQRAARTWHAQLATWTTARKPLGSTPGEEGELSGKRQIARKGGGPVQQWLVVSCLQPFLPLPLEPASFAWPIHMPKDSQGMEGGVLPEKGGQGRREGDPEQEASGQPGEPFLEMLSGLPELSAKEICGAHL